MIMAKLILVDNYNRETVADILLEENVSEEYAKMKEREYNNTHPCGDWCASAVEDDYKLWGGITELI